MKKITLMALLILSCTLGSAQCIRTNMYGTIVSNNSGNFQTITECALSNNEFSVISGLISDGNYVFTAQMGDVVGTGSPIYITVTDASNAVIQHGPSPLTINGISATTVRVHYSENAACAGVTSCRNSQVKYVTDCIVPLGLMSSGITTTTATINWTAPTPAPANGYDYYLSTTNTAPTAATVPTGTVTTGTSVSLSGLAIGTNYYIWVRSKCGANSTPWLSYNFATACNPSGNFTEGFEASATYGVMPTCWNKKIVSGSASPDVYVIDYDANTGSRCLKMANSSVAAATLYAIMPPLTDLPAQNHRLKFYVKGDSPVTFTVGTMTDPANDATFTPKQVIPLTPGYQQHVINFTTATTASFIAFKAAFSGSISNTVNIDNVIWESIPACQEASGVNVTSITGTTATLSWIASPSAPAQGYEYYLSSFNTPPTSTTVATGSVLSGTLANLTGLQSFSTYYVWVRSNCGTDKSPWTNTTTFMTGCPAFFVPNYTQDFASFVPVCWAVAGAGTPATGPTGTIPGIWEPGVFLNSIFTGAIKANLYSKDRIGWIVSPVIDLSAGGYRVKFDAGITAYGVDTPSAMGSDDQVILLISDNNGTNWTGLKTFNAANPLSNLKNTILTALIAHNSATTRFAFYATDGTIDDTQDYEFFIDNFVVEAIPACDVPNNVSVSALTSSSVNVSWPAITGAAGYEYVLDNVITNPAGAGTAITAASYQATGLTPLTSYYFHVRTMCGGTFSAWTTVNFATPTVAPSNDECTGAMALTIGGAYADNITYGTNLGATTSAQPVPTTCPGFSGGDVWFTAVVPASGSITIETGDSTTGTTDFDTIITAYTGSCGALTEVGCNDDGFTDNSYSKLALTGQTPGATLYIRAYEYNSDGSDSNGVFGISAYNSVLSNPSFNAANFKAYPNPVKDFLNLSYAQDISNVTIFNLLGQQVLAKKVNASKSRIDMSGISAGTYFVKVIINNQVNTIKVIKQ